VSAESLVLIGGGEHARVLIDAARGLPERFRLVGFIDPRPCEPTQALGVPWLGDDEVAARRDLSGCLFLLGVGPTPRAPRRPIAARYQATGVRWATLVHARATVSPAAHLGAGVAVLAGAVVGPGARIGEHGVVNSSAVVEHDVTLGAHTHVAPAAAIGGGARLGESCHVGLGSRVRDHVTLGDSVIVGMGAVVVRSHGDRVMLLGVPARETSHG
jgi:acetyltransferase EpsM